MVLHVFNMFYRPFSEPKRLPFLAFDCPSSAFSNVAAFPSLSRLGTPLEPFPRIIERLRARHGWSKAFLITGRSPPVGGQAVAEAIRASMARRPRAMQRSCRRAACR